MLWKSVTAKQQKIYTHHRCSQPLYYRFSAKSALELFPNTQKDPGKTGIVSIQHFFFRSCVAHNNTKIFAPGRHFLCAIVPCKPTEDCSLQVTCSFLSLLQGRNKYAPQRSTCESKPNNIAGVHRFPAACHIAPCLPLCRKGEGTHYRL